MIVKLARKAKKFWALSPDVRWKFLRKLLFSSTHKFYMHIKTKIWGDFKYKAPEFEFISRGFYQACLPNETSEFVSRCVDRWLQQEYNILGSDWKRHCTTERTYFFKNKRTENNSRAVLKYIHRDYRYVLWHHDIKSYFQYDHNAAHHNVKIPINVNTDIKNLWEISRMQHLVLVAHRYSTTKNKKDLRYIFSNILDFIAHNPPGRGVNWACTMDVSIRLVNWLITLDIVNQSGEKIDKSLYRIIVVSLQEHAYFIRRNLEWSPVVRGNHYYSNLAALIIFECYTNKDSTVLVKKLSDVLNEFVTETFLQFNDDGSNFEGSTYYHFLTTEMLIYTLFALEGVCALKNLEQSKLDKLYERLDRSIDFMKALQLPNNNILQIGDTDSGAFVKFCILDCKPTLGVNTYKKSSIDSENTYPIHDSENYINKEHIIEHTKIIQKNLKKYYQSSEQKYGSHSNVNEVDYQNLHEAHSRVYSFRSKGNLLKNSETFVFPNFGLVIKKSDSLFLSFRCGTVGQLGNGGHSHFDQLSIELWIDNKPVVVDPGSVCYTSNLVLRDGYRSSKAHFVPRIIGMNEPGEMGENTFSIKRINAGQFLKIEPKLIIAVHQGYGFDVYRKIEIHPNELIVRDYHCSAKHKLELVNNNSVIPCIGYSVVSRSDA